MLTYATVVDMKGRHWLVIACIAVVIGGLAYALSVFMHDPVLLRPSGNVGVQQRDLLYFATAVMLVVIVPVFIMTAVIARRYRASNTAAPYTPRADRSRMLETIWWGVPIAVVALLSVVAWQTSHNLDPFRPLDGARSYPVQVIALQWKWLFLYPEQQTASVNELVIPVNRPVAFAIASDAPMNSCWIPELGGQIYAMSGMNTQLHLIADRPGTFRGVSSNLSGSGFADMKFSVRAMSDTDLAAWHYDATMSEHHLTLARYDELARPSIMADPQRFRLDEPTLYQTIIDKYLLAHSTMDHEGGR